MARRRIANVKQQLPAVESIDSFLALPPDRHRAARHRVLQCHGRQPGARATRSSARVVNPNQGARRTSAIRANQNPVINAIRNKVINSSLATQPNSAVVVTTAIRELLNTIANNPASQRNPTGAGNAMKAACGAALGSAATTLQ